jgi:hypothetical protein
MGLPTEKASGWRIFQLSPVVQTSNHMHEMAHKKIGKWIEALCATIDRVRNKTMVARTDTGIYA